MAHRINPRKRAEFMIQHVFPAPPAGKHWEISQYNPGGNRWQIALVDDVTGGYDETFPRGGHWPTRNFLDFLDGMQQMADMLDVVARDKATA